MKGESGFNIKELLSQCSMELLEGKDAEEHGNSDHERQAEKTEVKMIDVFDLEPSRENFYHVDDSLKRSIELVGILQPLLVTELKNGKYKVIAGHRRRMAVLSLVEDGNETRRYVPCVFKKEDVRDRLAIIMANRFRDKTDWERMMEAVEAEGLAKELKKDYKLGGRTREVLAEITGLSEAQLGRYKAIFNHLDQGLMEDFRADRIGFSAVSELCGLPQEWQEEAGRLLKEKGALSLPEIKEWRRQKEEKVRMPVAVAPLPDKECRKDKAELKEKEKSDTVARQISDSQTQDREDRKEEDSAFQGKSVAELPKADQEDRPYKENSKDPHDISIQIIERFVEFLQRHHIVIPDVEKNGEKGNDPTELYGTICFELLDEVERMLKPLTNEDDTIMKGGW